MENPRRLEKDGESLAQYIRHFTRDVTLGEIGDERAIEPIVALLKIVRVHDSLHEVFVSHAAEALGKIGGPRVVESLLMAVRSGANADLLQVLEKIDPNALKSSPDAKRAAVPSLLAQLESLQKAEYAAKERRDIINQLSEIGDARAVEPLLIMLKSSSNYYDEYEKGAAILALGKIGDPRAVEPLLALLKDWQTEYWAARALGMIRDSRAVEPLIEKLQEPTTHAGETQTRPTVAIALSRIGDPRALKPLLEYSKKITEVGSWGGTAKAIVSFIHQVLKTDIERISLEDIRAVADLNQITEGLYTGSTEYGYENYEERKIDASHVSSLARRELARRESVAASG